MSRPAAVPRALSRLVFGLVMVSCAYFVQGAGPNQNSRYALVRALVEHGTVEIDEYQTTTHDISTQDGHWYSDKAPGLSLVAAVPYALGVRVAQAPDALEPSPIALHLLTLLTCSLATALAAVALLHLLVGVGLGRVPALLAVVGWVLGTNAFAYAGLFVAHQLVAALIVLALAGLHAAGQVAGDPGRRATRLALGSGVAAGFAVISEFPVGLLAIALGAYACATLGLRRTVPYALGALIPVALLLVYNTACFGNPLHLGYQSLANEYFAEAVQSGVLGFGAPDLGVIGELTLREFRGLVPLSPFLLLALPGMYWMVEDRALRRLGVLCIVAFFALLIAISGFRFWHGGAAMGPRHLVAALPFAIIPVAVAIDRLHRYVPRFGVPVAATLIAVSIGLCTICVAVLPEFFDVQMVSPPAADVAIPRRDHPVTELALPLFTHGHLSNKATWSGKLSLATWVPGHDDDAFNLGETIGLSGIASLIPLALAWLAFGVAIGRQVRRADRGAEPG